MIRLVVLSYLWVGLAITIGMLMVAVRFGWFSRLTPILSRIQSWVGRIVRWMLGNSTSSHSWLERSQQLPDDGELTFRIRCAELKQRCDRLIESMTGYYVRTECFGRTIDVVTRQEVFRQIPAAAESQPMPMFDRPPWDIDVNRAERASLMTAVAEELRLPLSAPADSSITWRPLEQAIEQRAKAEASRVVAEIEASFHRDA